MKETTWLDLADAFAFLGNSLLAPMSQTGPLGLDPELWESMPSMGEVGLEEELSSMAEFVGSFADEEGAVRQISVEWTHLFVGPPKPACSPWETYYRREGVTSGFGAATFEMREVLRDLGLKVDGPSNQFEDHVGIELLALSEMCRRAGEGGVRASSEECAGAEAAEAGARDAGAIGGEQGVREYLERHLLRWLPAFAQDVVDECPGGYFARLFAYAARLTIALAERV